MGIYGYAFRYSFRYSFTKLYYSFIESVSNQYDPLTDNDVDLPPIPKDSVPQIAIEDVYNALLRINTKSSTGTDDIPAKVIKMFAAEIAPPLAHIIETSIIRGLEFLLEDSVYYTQNASQHDDSIPKIFPHFVDGH